MTSNRRDLVYIKFYIITVILLKQSLITLENILNFDFLIVYSAVKDGVVEVWAIRLEWTSQVCLNAEFMT